MRDPTCGNMYHMGTPRGQPLEPCPLGAPAESLWERCPSTPPSGGSCGGPLGALPLRPALWGLLQSAFIQDHMGAPRGQPLEPHPLGAPKPYMLHRLSLGLVYCHTKGQCYWKLASPEDKVQLP